MLAKLNIEKEIVKVAIGFKALQSGTITAMSGEDFEKFMEWLD
jgi:hypothetical protein